MHWLYICTMAPVMVLRSVTFANMAILITPTRWGAFDQFDKLVHKMATPLAEKND